MATEKEQSTATPPTSKEEDRSSQGTGLIRKSQESGMAKRQRSGVFGLPLTPRGCCNSRERSAGSGTSTHI